MDIQLTNPRGNARKGEMGSSAGGDARILELGSCELFFSYATLVAFRAPGLRIRTDTSHSRTTAKHMHDMGIDTSFQALPEELFQAGVEEALVRTFAGAKVKA